MGKEDTKDLLKFLQPYPKEVQDNALWLRNFVWDLYPRCNELIYDNYNAVAFGWSPTDRVGHTFCSVAVNHYQIHLTCKEKTGNCTSGEEEKIRLWQGKSICFIREK